MRILFWLFYSGTVILWFKNSFSQLKSIPINYEIPLTGLIVISAIRIVIYIKEKKQAVKFKFDKNILFIIVLLMLAIGVRIPYLMNHAGLSDSDDGLTMLMSKHIADGKLPPLYFYKQYYQGSLFSHFSALIITLIGYSHLTMEIIILAFFLAFIAIQFHFFKKVFTLPFAVIASVFYCLPIGHLVKCSFFISSAYPLVLLLGSTILFLSHLIVYHDKTNLLPALGFLAGLAFWTHQICVIFILTALIMLAKKIHALWKKYLFAFFYVLMGCLPLIISEIFWNFHLVKYLMPGQGKSIGGANIKRTFEMSLMIFSQSSEALSYGYFFLLILGLIVMLYPTFKAKKLRPQSLFPIFFLSFAAVYLLSRFGEKNVVRYFYILYFCLPILFLGFFWIIRSKFKYYLMGLTLLFLFLGLNLKSVKQDLQTVKKAHRQRIEIVKTMKNTGKRFWRADFWDAYLLTALSAEQLIVDSYSVNRYFPYRLMYENEGETENFLFMTEGTSKEKRLSSRFPRLLEACEVDYRKIDLGSRRLVYDIQTPVSPSAFMAPVHEGFPDVEVSSMKYENGFLDINFANTGKKAGTDYWIYAEIPGYSALLKGFPPIRDQVDVRLPYPQKKSFPLGFYLIYKGIKMAQTQKDLMCVPPKEYRVRKKRIVFLSGVGPKVEFENKTMYACNRTTKIEINGKLEDLARIRLSLFSPFNFSDPAWYGDYAQEIEIRINGKTLRKAQLDDGSNVITIPMKGLSLKRNTNILSLEFRYDLFFNFAPYGKTAALLEEIELER